jgi:predicted ester cyclase
MERSDAQRLVERWLYDGICAGNLSAFDELLDDDARDLSGPTPLSGRDSFKQRASAVHGAFTNLTAKLDALLVEGDELAWRWSLTGTHSGPFAGVSATGRRVTLRGVNFQRLSGGRVVAHWTLVDLAGLLAELRA